MRKNEKAAEIEKLKKQFLTDPDILGPFSEFEIVKIRNEEIFKENKTVATEVPFTIVANEVEIVTLLALPLNLKELAAGFLFSSSFIGSIEELKSLRIDTGKWVAYCELEKTPDPDMMNKRLFTSGCGKGVMYGSIDEISMRHPITSNLKITKENITDLTRWLQQSSTLYRITGGVHNAALSFEGSIPEDSMDDVGRHNAVDKAIGKGLFEGMNLGRCVLISSGRTSSEILQKARKAGIPVTMSRGAPTHQTILRAKDMGITVVGFARGGIFNIYTHSERIVV